MTAKKLATTPQNSRTLRVMAAPGTSAEKAIADYMLRPTMNAACTVISYKQMPTGQELDLTETMHALAEQCDKVRAGDLSRAESMLTAQAHSLDAIFANFARRAAQNAGEYMGACETYLKLALRAQSQCRATLETLATMKNPPNVAFVKQANIAHGPQQVNNGTASEPARAEEKTIKPTELLEHDHGQRLDTGTASTARDRKSVV